MLTCRACGVEPYAYLRHVLTELPNRGDGDDIPRSAAVQLRQRHHVIARVGAGKVQQN